MALSRREAYIHDTSAPITVHDKEDIDLYHILDEETKIAWNRFAQSEAEEFDKHCDSYDTTSSYYRWTPCNFQEWVQERASAGMLK